MKTFLVLPRRLRPQPSIRVILYAVAILACLHLSNCSARFATLWPDQLNPTYWLSEGERIRKLLTSSDSGDRLTAHRLLRRSEKPVPEVLQLVLDALTAETMEERSWAIASMGTAFKHQSAHIPAVEAAVNQLEKEALDVDPQFGRESWIDMMTSYRISYLDRMKAIRDGIPTPQDAQFLPGGTAHEMGRFRPEVEARWPGWAIIDGTLTPPAD